MESYPTPSSAPIKQAGENDDVVGDDVWGSAEQETIGVLDPTGVRFKNLQVFLEQGMLGSWLRKMLQLPPDGHVVYKMEEVFYSPSNFNINFYKLG